MSHLFQFLPVRMIEIIDNEPQVLEDKEEHFFRVWGEMGKLVNNRLEGNSQRQELKWFRVKRKTMAKDITTHLRQT
jgi:uncharacterized phage-associated protein